MTHPAMPSPQTFYRRVSFAAVMLTGLFLSACGHTPVTSLYHLNKINSQTTKLSALRVAVQVPDQFKPGEKGVTLSAMLEKTPTEKAVLEAFKLERFLLPAGSSELDAYRSKTKRIYVFKIRSSDIARFERFRLLQSGKATGKKRSGSIAIAAHVCRRSERVFKKIVISTFLKTSETKKFVPLNLNVDLKKETGELDIDQLAPRCATKGV